MSTELALEAQTNYIAGQWVPAASGRTFENRSPADRDEAGMALWRRGLKLLAAQPNVAIKVSDLVAYDHNWTLASLREVTLACIDAFGPERSLFASDFPVAGLHATYDQCFDSFKAITKDFTAGEQRALFCENAARLYRITTVT